MAQVTNIMNFILVIYYSMYFSKWIFALNNMYYYNNTCKLFCYVFKYLNKKKLEQINDLKC